MAAIAMAPGLPSPQQHSTETLSTLPDPRSPLTPPDISRSNSVSPSQHPELSNEVASLSNKLIHAINHQTQLDDTLNDTRHDLEAAQEHIRQLERDAQEHRSLVANGILVKRSDIETDNIRLKTTLAEERKAKIAAEKSSKEMEAELEQLTSALFEEANQMVASARQDARTEREVIERRNEQLQAKLNDAELLLASHQEQLAELKSSMQDMSSQRNELETAASTSDAPSTPGLENNDRMSKILDALHLSPTSASGDFTPAPPTSFTHLLSPVLRTDVQAFEDFHALLEISRKSRPTSRVTSGTYSGLSGLGLSNLVTHRDPHHSPRFPSNGSTSSLSNLGTHPSTPTTPNLPPSTNSSVSSRDAPVTGISLKETPFYKRVLTEDIEPTLRLDLAPGLSWLARRSVISAMSEGKLVVEPIPGLTANSGYPPCALCGEQGRGERRARMHKFRTSESDSAQRYPLCGYCLNRVRASCDFLGFLRMVKDGHWRTDGSEAESMAWEESVRLREAMFWSRVGGGVIPAFLKAPLSPRSSSEEQLTNGVSPALSAISPALSTNSPALNVINNGRFTKPENPSPLAQVAPVEPLHDTPPEPIKPPTSSTTETPPPPPPEKDKPPSSKGQDLPEPRSTLTRSTNRPRGASGTEGTGGRQSIANSVAQRAAMFDRPASGDASTADNSQSSLKASLTASMSMRSRSSSKPRSKSPLPKPPQPEVPLPTPQRGTHGKSESSGMPGAFEF